MWQSCRALGRALGAISWPRSPSRTLPRCPPVPDPTGDPPSDPPGAQPQDLAMPNASWSDPMQRHYRRLLELAAAGAWVRLPSYRNARHHCLGAGGGGLLGGHNPKVPPAGAGEGSDTRLFLRAINDVGAGFEYAMFLNTAERRLLCLFQPGRYLEGHPGLTHGGAIATIVDTTLGTCALAVAGRVVTANLSIDYLAPVPLGTVLLVEAHTEWLEGRKMFLSGCVRGADGDTVFARATGLFIQLEIPKQKDGGR